MRHPRYPAGARVTATFCDEDMSGTVVDSIEFQGKFRYGVRMDYDGKIHDVWPSMNIRAEET
jgi:hypothetical protein